MRSLIIPKLSAAVGRAVCGDEQRVCVATAYRAVTTLLVAASLYLAHRNLPPTLRPSLPFLATAWSMLILSTRPFSNAAELAALAALAACAARAAAAAQAERGERERGGDGASGRRRRRLLLCTAVGALSVLGSWLRFTFPAFGLVPALAGLYAGASQRPLRALAGDTAAALAGVLLTLASLSALEAHLYDAPWPVFPPLRTFAYNARADRLALHGLHPW